MREGRAPRLITKGADGGLLPSAFPMGEAMRAVTILCVFAAAASARAGELGVDWNAHVLPAQQEWGIEDASARLSFSDVETALGSLALSGAAGQTARRQALTIDALDNAPFTDVERQSGLHVRAATSLFDNRMSFAAAFAQSQAHSSTYDDVNGLGSRIAEAQREGTAVWLQAKATLLDQPDVGWTLSADWSQIEAGFLSHDAARPVGHVAVAGEHLAVSTTFKADDTSGSVTFDRLSTERMARDLLRARFGIDGADVLLSEKSITRLHGLSTDDWREKSVTRAFGVDLMPELLMPEWHGSLGPFSPAIPSLISVTRTSGGVVYPGALPADQIEGWEAVLSWSTGWGETTAFYWQESLGHRAQAFGFTGSDDTIVDISHRVRIGDWQVGGGVSIASLSNRDAVLPYTDESVSGTFSLAYAPDAGPQFKLALGRNASDYALEPEDYRESRRALSLTLSADLSPLIRGGEKEGATLRLDYRAALETSAVGNASDDSGRHAFLATFATRF